MTDKARAYVRTLWPILLGHAAAWLALWLAPRGVDVDQAVVYEALGVLGSVLVYVTGYELERVRGTNTAAAAARWVGRFLLSLGLDIGAPIYARPGAAAYRAGTGQSVSRRDPPG